VTRARIAAVAIALVLLARPLVMLHGRPLQAGLGFAVAAAALLPPAFVWPASAAPATAGAMLVAEYAFALLARSGGGPDLLAPLMGVLLLALLELLDVDSDRRRSRKVERAVRLQQALWLLGEVAAGLVAGGFLLYLAARGGPADTSITRAMAFTAVALALAIPVLIARRVVGRDRFPL
jgi:hypothetical protein